MAKEKIMFICSDGRCFATKEEADEYEAEKRIDTEHAKYFRVVTSTSDKKFIKVISFKNQHRLVAEYFMILEKGNKAKMISNLEVKQLWEIYPTTKEEIEELGLECHKVYRMR